MRRANLQHGQALIESALGLLVLLLLGLGVLDLGLAIFQRQALEMRLRASARLATRLHLDDGAIRNHVLYGTVRIAPKTPAWHGLTAADIEISRVAHRAGPECLVLSVRMPRMNGLTPWTAGRGRFARVHVVIPEEQL